MRVKLENQFYRDPGLFLLLGFSLIIPLLFILIAVATADAPLFIMSLIILTPASIYTLKKIKEVNHSGQI